MQQRLSISDLWNVLQRDSFYRDRTSVRVVIKELKFEYLKPPLKLDLNPQLVASGYTTDSVFMLIFVLCGLCRLNTYQPNADKPTGWFGQEFADKCSHKLDLEIDRDDFRELLFRLELPLPEAWFPEDEVEPQKDIANLRAVKMEHDAVARESTVPVIGFYKKGELWWIGEKGKEVSFYETKGLGFIHFLLNYPHEEFRPEFVYNLGATLAVEGKRTDHDELEAKRAFFQKRLDRKTRNACRIRIDQLQERLEAQDHKDPQEALEMHEEINQLENALKRRKIRNHISEEEKARENVSKAIDRTLSEIYELVPSLNKYLNKHTSKKGDSFSYRPLVDNKPDWKLYPNDLTS